jgi:hypothetical protein
MDALTEGNILNDSDLTLLQAYALKVEEHLTDKAFNKLCFAFPQSPIDSLKNTEKCVQFLSGFQPMRYHCCPFSCICYTGPYESLNKCPKCNIDWYKVDGTPPQAIFEYLPIIPCLLAMLVSSSYARKMQYQSKCEHDPTTITDIFDGTQYCSLLETFITIGDEELPTWYFPIFVTLHLGCPQMALVPSSAIPRLHGQLFYLIITSLLKSSFSSRTSFRLE